MGSSSEKLESETAALIQANRPTHYTPITSGTARCLQNPREYLTPT